MKHILLSALSFGMVLSAIDLEQNAQPYDTKQYITNMVHQLIIDNITKDQAGSHDVINDLDAILASIAQHRYKDDTFTIYELIEALKEYVSLYRSQQSIVQRMWDDANTIFSRADVIDSKIGQIDDVVNELMLTVTIINAINTKSCSIESSLDTVLSLIDIVDSSVETNVVKVTSINQEIGTIESLLDVIRVDEFGSKWSDINALQTSFCDEYESTLETIATICSKVELLSTDNLEQFIATFTKLETLMDDVFDTMTAVEDFSNQIDTDLSTIESLIDIVSTQLITIESKIDYVSSVIDLEFDGTFTTLDQQLQTICSMESNVIALQDILGASLVGTATTLEAFLLEMCSIESRVDILDTALGSVKTKANIVDMQFN